MRPRSLNTKERAELFLEHKGVCHLCSFKINEGERWEVSHPTPLAAGGEDVPENRAPAHKKCHARQTAKIDAPLIAKVRRQHQKSIGATAPSRNPVPGGRSDKWRKKVSGQVVPRHG